MNVPSIQITQQFGQIGINHSLGLPLISYSNNKIQVETTNPKVHISSTDTKMNVEQKKALAAIGIASSEMFSRHHAKKGKSNAMSYIGKVAREGDQLQRVQDYPNHIPRLAKAKGMNLITRFDPVQKGSILNVNVNFDIADLHVTPQEGRVQVKYPRQLPNQEVSISREPAYAKIYLQQKPYIDIHFPKIDQTV